MGGANGRRREAGRQPTRRSSRRSRVSPRQERSCGRGSSRAEVACLTPVQRWPVSPPGLLGCGSAPGTDAPQQLDTPAFRRTPTGAGGELHPLELPSRVTLVRWRDRLAEIATSVLDPASTRLFATLADTLGRGDPLPPPPVDLSPLEARGRWLRVRLRWPYAMCEGPDTAGTSVREAWIAYLDRRGRPLVFYPPRGC